MSPKSNEVDPHCLKAKLKQVIEKMQAVENEWGVWEGEVIGGG